jgi:hypothetical protein
MTTSTERPAEVATRTGPGQWEGDVLKGARNGSAVGTLVERTTRLGLLARMDGPEAASAYFTRKLRRVPAPLRNTLTDDRGKEMVEHQRLAHRLAIQVFFTDPHSLWQRGSNEHTHGLLRQDLPKGTSLSGYTKRELNALAPRLNSRPRNVSVLPPRWRSMRNCAIIHPLHLELETATSFLLQTEPNSIECEAWIDVSRLCAAERFGPQATGTSTQSSLAKSFTNLRKKFRKISDKDIG